MNPRVKDVRPNQNYTINIVFDNGEEKVFDVAPYLDRGIFRELKDQNLFRTVRPCLGSVQWKNGQDFCPDTLYLEGKRLTKGSSRAATRVTGKTAGALRGRGAT